MTAARPQGRWKPATKTAPSTDEAILAALERLVGVSERNSEANKKTASIAAIKTDLVSLAIIWVVIALAVSYMALMTTMAAIADTPAGKFFGLSAGDYAIEQLHGGGSFASPIVGRSLQDLVDYKPSHGQSFGPETGNKRSYGPHGGVDFDCRVGGCAGADIASPISGKVTRVHKIGTSANGASYQVHVVGEDWAGAVEHQLVHVDSIVVAVGDTVTAGQVVAKVSPTDSVSTGPHFDWKIKRGGGWVNPQTWAREAIAQGGRSGGSPSDELLKRAIGRAEGTRDRNGNPTAAYAGHKDPGWSGRCKNQGSFSYQHCAGSPEEADAKWLVELRKAERSIQGQAQAKFGGPLSMPAIVAALDGYTQSPDAGKRFVQHLQSANPGPQQIIAARTAALNDSRSAKGGPPMNVLADQQRRVNALLEQL